MPEHQNPFGSPLTPDPAAALTLEGIRFPQEKAGPVHGAQFIVELAGPKSVSAGQAHGLLQPAWQAPLGKPELWVMAPADSAWRPMAAHDTGSYDSIALAWDLIGEAGEISGRSAQNLLQAAESFAHSIQRRAFPFPTPAEIDGLVRSLLLAQESFDIGVELIIQGDKAMLEREIWRAAAALGFDLAGDGLFVWKGAHTERPLLTLAPIEEERVFSLGQVQNGETHEALSLGFNVPASPDPAAVLEKALQAADRLAQRLGVQAFDDEGHHLSESVRNVLRNNLAAGIRSMQGSGLIPGTPICLKLFA